MLQLFVLYYLALIGDTIDDYSVHERFYDTFYTMHTRLPRIILPLFSFYFCMNITFIPRLWWKYPCALAFLVIFDRFFEMCKGH